MATGEPFKLNPTTLPIGFIVTSDKIDTWWKKNNHPKNISSSYRKKSNPYPTPNVFFSCQLPDPAQKIDFSKSPPDLRSTQKRPRMLVATNQHFGWYPIQGFDDFRCESRWFWINSSLNLLRKKIQTTNIHKASKKKKERALNCRKVLETGKYHHLLYRLSSDHFMCSFLSQICFERKRLPHLHVWNI